MKFEWIVGIEDVSKPSVKSYSARIEPLPKGMAFIPKSLTRERAHSPDGQQGVINRVKLNYSVYLYEVATAWLDKCNLAQKYRHASFADILLVARETAFKLSEGMLALPAKPPIVRQMTDEERAKNQALAEKRRKEAKW